jgi:CRISPR-associated exonuclease Cas4
MNPIIPLIILLVGLGFIAYAFILRRHTTRQRDQHGIPTGTLLYSDLTEPAEPLFSRRLQLAGKPDYIIRQDNHLVPVEVKTGHHTHPQPSHVLQLAAYCQLLEDTTGEFVPYGILILNQQPTKIPFDPTLRFSLEQTLRKMRHTLKTDRVEMNHHDPHRCVRCSQRQNCTLSLGEQGSG